MLTPHLRTRQLISKHCDEWERIYCQLAVLSELMVQIWSLCSRLQFCLNLNSVHKASSLFCKHTGLIRCWSEQMFAKVSSHGVHEIHSVESMRTYVCMYVWLWSDIRLKHTTNINNSNNNNNNENSDTITITQCKEWKGSLVNVNSRE